MPFYNKLTRQRVADIVLGLRVDRAVATHAATTTPYFTVVGEILLTGLVGKVVDESGANACSWSVNPTAGTTVSICGDLDINASVTGDLFGISGVLATAMGTGGAVLGIMQPLFITAGTIDFIAASASGSTTWSLFYVPVSEGAYVAVA